MKKYNIIYIDPPWQYRNKNTGGSMNSGSANKYSTLSIKELMDLPIKKIIDKNCVIFLWVTVPFMEEGFRLLKQWGFKYKTMITWRKIMSLGMGYWMRGQTEHILFGVRGKVKAFRLQEPNFIQCKVEKHSKKPEVFRELIERLTKNMPERNKIEIFANQKIDGWDSIGDEIDGLDIRDALNNIINR